MADLNNRMGHNLRTLREAKKLSQTQLGKLVGIEYQQISLYENGHSNFSTDIIERFAEGLGVHPDAILAAEVKVIPAVPGQKDYIERLKGLFRAEKELADLKQQIEADREILAEE